jgi:hypothetical protein
LNIRGSRGELIPSAFTLWELVRVPLLHRDTITFQAKPSALLLHTATLVVPSRQRSDKPDRKNTLIIPSLPDLLLVAHP